MRDIDLDIWGLQAVKAENSKLRQQVKFLKTALSLACQEVVEVDQGNCPGCVKNQNGMKCDVPKEKFAECWREYFLKKARDMSLRGDEWLE